MTYSTGGIVQATDYNGFVSTTPGGNINATWNTAYGQTLLPTVSTGTTVTAAQWASLNSTISSMAAHQGTSITARTNPTTGGVVSVLSNLGTDITNCYNNLHNASTLGSQFTNWTGAVSKTSTTGAGTSSWSINYSSTISFASVAAANYFFNSGGLLKIQFSKTSTGNSSDNMWNNFVNGICGAIYLSSTGASKTISGYTYTGTTKIGGSGAPTILATGIGFQQLSSTPTAIYKQFDGGVYAYSSNYVLVQASLNGSTITINTTWYDNGDLYGSVISGGTPTSGIIFGTAPTTLVTYFSPETTYISNSWGSPTISSTVV